MDGHIYNGGAIPFNIVVTQQTPDIVFIDRTTSTVWLFELTVSFETNVDQAHTSKKESCQQTLKSLDIDEKIVHLKLVLPIV